MTAIASMILENDEVIRVNIVPVTETLTLKLD